MANLELASFGVFTPPAPSSLHWLTDHCFFTGHSALAVATMPAAPGGPRRPWTTRCPALDDRELASFGINRLEYIDINSLWTNN